MVVSIVDEYIAIDPHIAAGKARIQGHRITVQNIAVWHERMGISVDAIAHEYDLTLAEVYAALSYYFAHRVAIDKTIQESEKRVQMMRQHYPTKLTPKLAQHCD